MLRVMIVEDEALPRIALRNIVEKEHLFIGEAACGTDAEALALKLKPDVILVDIIMPDFDGFELIRRLSPKLPDTRYLIISNVENSEYLKKAIRLHVEDYLIKGTITADVLLEMLYHLDNEISESRTQEPEPEENDPSSSRNYIPVFFGEEADPKNITGICSQIGFPREDSRYFCLHFQVVSKSVNVSARSIRLMVREILDDSGEGRTVSVNDQEIVALFEAPAYCVPDEAVRDFAERVLNSVKNSFGAVLSCGISRKASGTENIHSAYIEAGNALDRAWFTGPNVVNVFDPEEYRISRKGIQYINSCIRNITRNDAPIDSATYKKLLDEIKKTARDSILPREFIQGAYMDVLLHAFSLNGSSGDSSEQNQGLSRLRACSTLEEFHNESLWLLLELKNVPVESGDENAIIRQVKDYIDAHIEWQLSLEELSSQVYLSPAYLSQLFKRTTGEKLRGYIVSARIRRAKELLGQGRSIHDTAVMTGFTSDSYFIQCFREATQTTPKEYIRELGKPKLP